MYKVLIVGATTVNSADISLSLKKAFEKQNCEARLISANEDFPFLIDFVYHAAGKKVNDKVRSLFSRYVFDKAKTWNPDVVFLNGSNVFVSATTIKDLQNKLGCKVVLWELNNRCFVGYQAEAISLYDHIFSLDSYLLPVLRVSGAKNVHTLFACADPQEYSLENLDATQVAKFKSDISFIGSAYPERAEILRQLADYDLRIYGKSWKRYPELASRVSDQFIMDITKLKIFSNSRISINIQGAHMINGENFRVFEAAACGGVSFSTYKPDLAQCFKPDSEIIIFDDARDLREKADYYLAHLAELQAIGQAARRRLLAEHTYDHRVKTILKYLQLN
jgi:spore maturation protein CgeB